MVAIPSGVGCWLWLFLFLVVVVVVGGCWRLLLLLWWCRCFWDCLLFFVFRSGARFLASEARTCALLNFGSTICRLHPFALVIDFSVVLVGVSVVFINLPKVVIDFYCVH